MKSIKISSAISLLILLSVSFTSCEHEHIFTLENINLEKKYQMVWKLSLNQTMALLL